MNIRLNRLFFIKSRSFLSAKTSMWCLCWPPVFSISNAGKFWQKKWVKPTKETWKKKRYPRFHWTKPPPKKKQYPFQSSRGPLPWQCDYTRNQSPYPQQLHRAPSKKYCSPGSWFPDFWYVMRYGSTLPCSIHEKSIFHVFFFQACYWQLFPSKITHLLATNGVWHIMTFDAQRGTGTQVASE